MAVWAAETCPGRSVDLREAALPQPLALVLGNELIGVGTQVLDACDGVVSIPTFGVKNSINVATAMHRLAVVNKRRRAGRDAGTHTCAQGRVPPRTGED